MAISAGLVSVTFRKLTPCEIIARCVTCKLYGVEWGGDIHVPPGNIRLARLVGKMTVSAGLKVASYGSYYNAGKSFREGNSFESIRDTAHFLGAPTIRVWAGICEPHEATNDYYSRVIEDLKRISNLAEEAGMKIVLEFHSGTLTGDVESTLRLLRGLPDSVDTNWQPPVGMEPEFAENGLKALLPRLGNLHVFHWWPDFQNRHPLSVGRDAWFRYMAIAKMSPSDRWALLEFVRADDPGQLEFDAMTLHEIIKYS